MDYHNIGFIFCIPLSIIFAIFALVFAIMGEKAAMLLSGFNTLPKEERIMYDQKRMCADQRNAFILWAVIFAAGAVLSAAFSGYAAIAASVIWLVIFFRDVHLDARKAFKQYKKL